MDTRVFTASSICYLFGDGDKKRGRESPPLRLKPLARMFGKFSASDFSRGAAATRKSENSRINKNCGLEVLPFGGRLDGFRSLSRADALYPCLDQHNLSCRQGWCRQGIFLSGMEKAAERATHGGSAGWIGGAPVEFPRGHRQGKRGFQAGRSFYFCAVIRKLAEQPNPDQN